MRKAFLLSILLMTVLLSCTRKEDFSVSEETLVCQKKSCYAGSSLLYETETLQLSFSSSEQKGLILRASSPDGILHWTSKIMGDKGVFESEQLELTSGASFPEGSYEFLLSDANGNDIKLSLDYQSPVFPELPVLENRTLSFTDSFLLTELNDQGEELFQGTVDSGSHVLDAHTTKAIVSRRQGNCVSVSEYQL